MPLTIAPLFTDHAVLQAEKCVSLWGWAKPEERVKIEFQGQSKETKTETTGRWCLNLDPLPSTGDAGNLIISGSDHSLILRDIVIGEVWFCSGQSNMGWPVNRTDRAAQDIPVAHFPQIRHFATPQIASADPSATFTSGWEVCSPATVGQFTAVGFYFARNLQETLNVPIGLVNSTWGGTLIESWASAEGLASRPEFQIVHSRWQDALARLPERKVAFERKQAAWRAAEAVALAQGDTAHRTYLKDNPPLIVPLEIRPSSAPSSLFNGMIHPHLPATIRGILWYQGESNTSRAKEYRALFENLITSWRAAFQQGDLPFLWVQLPNYNAPTPEDWVTLREMQSEALVLPKTGQVVTMDLGDPDDVHPANKKDVGERLALLAKEKIYGISGESSGPTLGSVTTEGAKLRLNFEHAEGLHLRQKNAPSLYIAGTDRQFHPATISVENKSLIAFSHEVKKPIAARHAWSNSLNPSVFNGSGLPAGPFRTDRW